MIPHTYISAAHDGGCKLPSLMTRPLRAQTSRDLGCIMTVLLTD